MAYYKKRSTRPRRKQYRKKRTVRKPMKRTATYKVNTASIRECQTQAFPDGQLVFYRNLGLDDAQYDRAQTVAQAYQEFRIKYVKLTFRPSCDTFTPVAGNTIPQLYFQLDRANAIETDCNLQTLYDMGCRPIRFDSKNIVKKWRPTVLTTDMLTAGQVTASQVRVSPWLSTNRNAGNPGAQWFPSGVDHLGAVWHVTQMNPATPNINYNVDFEVVFEFRKPLWQSVPEPQRLKTIII